MAWKKYLCCVIFIAGCFRLASGQVIIWQEDFSQYPDGTTQGENYNEANPDLDWVSGECQSCIDTADWWEVRSGAMEARDVNEVVFLQLENIDISEFSNVRLKLDITESGDHEGLYFGLDACADQDKEDYVNVLYRIDGGSWSLVSNALNWCGLYESCGSHTLYGDDGVNSGDCRDHDDDWGTAEVSASGLSGNCLEIRLETINSATDEVIRFDNLLVEGDKLLPVTLKAFNASVRKDRVLLRWQTVFENNNDYFDIERSALPPFGDWVTIARVNGSGTSHEINEYFYEDLIPLFGKAYYRLKQVDFDGRFEYSEIKSVAFSPLTNPYPNPASDYFIIPLNLPTLNHPLVKVFNIGATEVVVNNISNTENRIILDISNLPTGNYIVSLNNITYRLVVIR